MSERRSSPCPACSVIILPASRSARQRPLFAGTMGLSSNITGGALAANIAWWPVLTEREISTTRPRQRRHITTRTSLQIVGPGTLGLSLREHRVLWRNVLSVSTGSTRGLKKGRRSGQKSSRPASRPARLMQGLSGIWMTFKVRWRNSWRPVPHSDSGRSWPPNRKSFISRGEPFQEGQEKELGLFNGVKD